MPDAAVKRFFRFPVIYNWIFQPRGPEAGEIFLHQRRVFIFPTRYGFFFAFSLLAFLAASINYDLSLGFVLTFFLASAGLVAMLHTFRNQVHLTLRPLKADPVFAGTTATFELLLDNRHDRERAAIWLRAPECDIVLDLPPLQPVTAHVRAAATRRGWLHPARITVETRYPLGLLRAWSYWQPVLPCLVYPQPAATGLNFPDAPEGGGDGTPRGAGNEDFAGLREHRNTDSPRHIAWKTAALALTAGGPLLSKHFLGAASSEVILDLDSLPQSLDIEARLSQLTRWVLDAEELKLHYGLKLGPLVLEPAQGSGHQADCLKALALYGSTQPDSGFQRNDGSGGNRPGGGRG